jgi:hypothetical protein
VFTKEEKKAINTTFWGNVKKALNKVPDAEGKFIQWLNYPLKIKDGFLRLTVDNQKAIISLDIQSSDEGVRALIWEQLEELRKVMESEVTYPAVWDKNAVNNAGQNISQIRWELDNVSLYESKDEDKIINFFSTTLKQFDTFYSEFGDVLKNLVN